MSCIVLFAKWRKGRPKGSSIPHSVSEAVESLVCRALSDNQEVTAPCVTETLQWALEMHDGEVGFVNGLVDEHTRGIILEAASNPEADWEDAGKRAWKYQSPSNCSKTGGRLLISTLRATANSISGIHRKTELSFFEWSWEETLCDLVDIRTGDRIPRNGGNGSSYVKDPLVSFRCEDLIVRLICERSYCEDHM